MDDRNFDKVSGDAPAQSYRLLRRMLPKALHPYARGVRKRLLRGKARKEEPFQTVWPYTQVSQKRQDSILDRTTALIAEGVPGDFVECGVLDGGTAAIMAYAARHDESRRVHLFDAWEGLPQATDEDGEGAAVWVGDVVGSPRRVMAVLRKVGAAMDRVTVHRGWFDDTLPVADVRQIAFLHVDCDFYAPVKLVLNTFVPRMAPGGWVQIDDYQSFEGCRLAVNEFLADRPDIALIDDRRAGGATVFRIP
ncbi:hypothetical protein OCGS_2452 [Oceaniovalibus guishaninsula JLT2003]|uniref:Methyltransferase n=1 Tax=Oceaniovalibus guishaninsula JLT2003 TaxID=1231392 RepID=K2HKC4_9RHOB|nr:TylF/MycF/NovP-related O-methyltransferase [Oceaniovalibus guishaninsula]EKE43414.1 hypothetical protein OCGS_2452 [Oceaniovalibus guishaninsula JLT2003]